ncbi:MAG: MarR family winged helix-turn-helix transcriptional regulator [Candidatus Spyradocola sp.]
MDYHALAQELIRTLAYRKLPTESTRQLSSGEQGILNYLHFVRDGVMSGELSREIGITTGRTAIALKNLEGKGLIQRRVSAEDRRCVQVYVTPEGAGAAEAMRTKVLDATTYVLTALGEHDAQEYVRIVKRIAALPHPNP